jgi:hypothetical protein
MTKHIGWLGLLLGLALVPSACGSDDDDTGPGGAGTGGASSAGKGGGSNAGKGGGSSGGDSGTGGASGESNTAGNGGEGPTEPIEIAGTWKNADDETFEETDIIDSDSWSTDYGAGPYVIPIVEYSNRENYAIRQAPEDAGFDPGTFDRVVWTEIDGDAFAYCTPDHGIATLEEARESLTPVDPDDLDAGCDGFPWTQLTSQ